MPLFYVSPEVAKDRSKLSGPIEPGFYVCAEAGKRFEVRISPFTTNACKLTAPDHDRVLVHVEKLLVTRRSSFNSGISISVSQDTEEQTHRGSLDILALQNVVGAIELASMPSSDNIGTITTTFTGCSRGKLRDSRAHKESSYNVHGKAKMTEKEMIKKGASIGVCGGGAITLRERCAKHHYPVGKRQVMSQKSINIYIRDKLWFLSRRLVDGKGIPTTVVVAKQGVGVRLTSVV
ncbi:hypothetical protein SARC_09345 [Sphaeroforma arctica JP610]|uniref:Uncharacterized protein n=1 Tax=Sphaeroforma arctica JP610 TaxID=667725 RepID=A0A0L0FQD9_9EUKA|nr:hypothetical protein SARC_09345 [Sphaeroforma arctica JP610]KNC78218.1 hypothetical protein SARC_09345 [Sphaeroforma arctica JP610]|eukprot:XP_014152120.1 hypothetical protein SARC_09345 [Sphaeroforma arctica JP610]